MRETQEPSEEGKDASDGVGRRGLSRRTLLLATALGAATTAAGVPALAGLWSREDPKRPAAGARAAETSYRAEYHFTVPEQWMNDPQRPIWVDGQYLYYYLYNADYLDGGTQTGTAWRLATSTDLVTFEDQGIAIAKDTTPNGDVWSGAAVIDTDDTAGYGANAVIALVTMEPEDPEDDPNTQAQYLHYSTDGGRTFTHGPTDPVLPNPGVRDFRDPKMIRDEDNDRWVMALTENDRVGFYHSPDLKEWTYADDFRAEGIGVLECPDLFQLTAENDTTRWVLGVSANGKEAGLPNTYAYWIGDFDGTAFQPEHEDPLWLDHGFDWYGAVTFDRHETDGSIDPTIRYAIGWMNNWDYANTTPTIDADGFNGTDSIVREVTLRQADDDTYYLASRPIAALHDHVSRTVELGDLAVDGELDVEYTGLAYELTTEVTWEDGLTVAGLQLRRSPDGSRHIDVGVHDGDSRYAFVNRGTTVNPDQSGSWQESQTPLPADTRSVKLRVLVDRTTVEVFVDDGRHTHSMLAFPYLTDTGLALFSDGGTAVFRNTVVREFQL